MPVYKKIKIKKYAVYERIIRQTYKKTIRLNIYLFVFLKKYTKNALVKLTNKLYFISENFITVIG